MERSFASSSYRSAAGFLESRFLSVYCSSRYKPVDAPAVCLSVPALSSSIFSPFPLAILLVVTVMAFSTPSFLSRLARPFFTSSRLSLTPDGAGAAVAAATVPPGAQKATIAAGCFWGVEQEYRKHFAGKGLYDARVGYTGGDASNPSYRAVCSGGTGHAEATQLIFDPEKVTYAQLIEFFYRMHDPTTKNQQGNDTGSQYRSGIFYHDADQERIAREVTAKANEQWWGGNITTEILPAKEWWDAEEYHQKYLDKNPFGYVCYSHHVRDFPPLK